MVLHISSGAAHHIAALLAYMPCWNSHPSHAGRFATDAAGKSGCSETAAKLRISCHIVFAERLKLMLATGAEKTFHLCGWNAGAEEETLWGRCAKASFVRMAR